MIHRGYVWTRFYDLMIMFGSFDDLHSYLSIALTL